MALSWNAAGDGARVTVGRQFAEALANVSLFDGAAAEYRWSRWSAGAFGGTQPDAVDLGWSGDVREYGAWVQMRSAPASPRRWVLTSGAVGSYREGEIDREFLFAQASLTTSRVGAYLVQELDWNRGWRADAGERALAPTSTLASLRVRASDALVLHGGVDSRRRVRLYRDRETPETEFDDGLRRGAWGGASLLLWSRLRLGVDGRWSDGAAAGRAESYTASLGVDRIAPLALALRARSTRYESARAAGWLHAASVGVAPLTSLRVEVNGGMRDDRARQGIAAAGPDGATRVRWLGADIDLALARSWYLLLSATRERGGWESSDQLYASVSWRF
jgi:hypothetical protein